MNRSNFPEQIDTFLEHLDPQANELVKLQRFQALRFKATLTQAEVGELTILTNDLREKIFTAEDFNKLQDAITNMQLFFRDNVQGYIAQKQGEMELFITNKVADVTLICDDAIAEITRVKNEAVTSVNQKKDETLALVAQKQNEIIQVAQDFTSNSALYSTAWIATESQKNYDIFLGINNIIPEHATLDFSAPNVEILIGNIRLQPDTEYTITKSDGLNKIITLNDSVLPTVIEGTRVFARWYKNVGKLYHTHAITHEEGSSDSITVTEGMLDEDLKKKLGGVYTGDVMPENPEKGLIWIATF